MGTLKMKKFCIMILLMILSASICWSQTDVRISDLPPATSAVTGDIVPVVVNMSTTPVTSYMTFGNMVVSLMLAKNITWSGDNVTFPGGITATGIDGEKGVTFSVNTIAYTQCTGSNYGFYVDNTGFHACVNGSVKTPSIPDEINQPVSDTLTSSEVQHSVINNYGQTVTTNNIQTLPTAAEGMIFTGIVGTLVNSTYYFEFLRGGSNTIYFADVASGTVNTGKTYVRATQQNVGSAIECKTFQTGSSTWNWFCKALSGTWTTD
jgi:hypothetical protein